MFIRIVSMVVLVLLFAGAGGSVRAGSVANRLEGIDRFETAQQIYLTRYPGGSVPFIHAVSGFSWPDALVAGPAAATSNGVMPGGPVILTSETNSKWLSKMDTQFDPEVAFVVGGESVISAATFFNIENRTVQFEATRLGGQDRYATAAKVTANAFPAADRVFIASGANFPDALSAGAAASNFKEPLLLVAPNAIPAPIAAELERLSPDTIVVVGGTGAISPGVATALRSYTTSHTSASVQRIGGADRYATAVAVSQQFFAPGSGEVFVSTGLNFPDALVAAPLGSPILLVPTTNAPAAVLDEIVRLQRGVTILGGYGAVSANVESQINAALQGG